MIVRIFLLVYELLWLLALPVVLAYLWKRSRKDPIYGTKLAERFGIFRNRLGRPPVWFHAVSLGETRSAVPLIQGLLQRGEAVVLTHFTPAGRRESEKVFAKEIANGTVQAVWVPFDTRWAFRGFFKAFRPKLGLVMEIEIWPGMIYAAKAVRVPLFMCNAQYPEKSKTRDAKGLRLRQRIMTGFAGALVKSDLQAASFASIGVPNIHVTGELRFDQPVPAAQLDAAEQAREKLGLDGRLVVTIASAVEGEDQTYILAIQQLRAKCQADGLPAPLVVYVPRAPERFGDVAQMLAAAGLNVTRRSTMFGAGEAGLAEITDLRVPDIILGDSMGEMYFYLSLADRVVVGGGFNPRGAHNIIEPLAVGKPVTTGPYVWTIEYPFVEAEAAGVAKRVPDAETLVERLMAPDEGFEARSATFFAAHSGAVDKTIAAISDLL